MTEATASTRVPLMLRVAHWELLVVSVCLIAIFAVRQTGNLPGATIRVLDVVLVAMVLALALHAGKVGRLMWTTHGVIAIASIVAAVVGVLTSSVTLQQIAIGVSAYLLAVAVAVIFWVVLQQRLVTGDTLFGALAGYLGVGMMFAMIYTLIARTSAEAFEPAQPVIDGQTDLYYFSLVTLTSLGYGDISPASNLTRILAPIEAVIGAILLAGLVGRIVGLLVAQTTEPATLARLDTLTRAVERLEPRSDRPDTHP